ncbi:hypothetical protein FEM41_18690 [Jejubacter calystegiae]|uniref:Uncharacterized protein n=1 Tax=Jejubacter calystegiae TaxID=2579935 RepID=A0A4P8YP64_9ENTR|nr:hypothetical protein FEM41_18690 [Jejubacter calystegiae]
MRSVLLQLAGYEGQGATANSIASRLVRNARVSRAIRWLRDRRQKRHAADLDELVHQLMAIATADPNELTQYRRVNRLQIPGCNQSALY